MIVPDSGTGLQKRGGPRAGLHLVFHQTWQEVHAKIQQATGPHEDLLTIIKRCKLQWYGYVSRSSGLAKTFLQGSEKGGRRQGRQKKEVGRQHQGMDRPGVRQVPGGSGEQGKMEKNWSQNYLWCPNDLRG